MTVCNRFKCFENSADILGIQYKKTYIRKKSDDGRSKITKNPNFKENYKQNVPYQWQKLNGK